MLWLPVILLAVVYYGVSAKIISMLWPYAPKKMRGVMYVYLLANSTMNVFAFFADDNLAYAGGRRGFISARCCSLFPIAACFSCVTMRRSPSFSRGTSPSC